MGRSLQKRRPHVPVRFISQDERLLGQRRDRVLCVYLCTYSGTNHVREPTSYHRLDRFSRLALYNERIQVNRRYLNHKVDLASLNLGHAK